MKEYIGKYFAQVQEKFIIVSQNKEITTQLHQNFTTISRIVEIVVQKFARIVIPRSYQNESVAVGALKDCSGVLARFL